MLSFGIPMGATLFIIIVFLFVKAWMRCKENTEIKLLLVCLFTTSGFMKLFLSSSFLLESNFFLLLGVCVGIIRFSNGEEIEYYVRKIKMGRIIF
jgi:hypothetical protein